MTTDVVLVVSPVERPTHVRDRLPSQHLGLAYLAASLRRAGRTVSVVDAKGCGLSVDETVRTVLERGPRLVGVTAMTHEMGRAGSFALRLKQVSPRTPVVVGGPHASAEPRQTLRDHPGFDHACIGEAEATIVELLDALDEPASHVPGTAARSPAGVELAPARPVQTDLDLLPFPAWDHFAWAPHFPVLTGRGCPHACVFCSRASGSFHRARNPDHVVEELEWLVRDHRASFFSFEDECFAIDRGRAAKLLDRMLAAGLDRVPWMANLHAATVDPDLARHMRAAGCRSVGVGIESGDEGILARSGKGLSLSVARGAVAQLRDVGLEVRAFFILGLPGETPSTALATIRFACELAPERCSFGILAPYPGTAVAALAARGSGGLSVRSIDPSDYDKHLGDALELSTLSRPLLGVLQLLAYVAHFLSRGRPGDLLRFAFRHRSAGLRALWKIVCSSARLFFRRPPLADKT